MIDGMLNKTRADTELAVADQRPIPDATAGEAFSVPSINIVQSTSCGLPDWVTSSEAAGEGTTAAKLKLQLGSGNKLQMEYGDKCPIVMNKQLAEDAFSVPSINVVQSTSQGLPDWVTASEGTTTGKLKLQLDSGNKLAMEYGDKCPIVMDKSPAGDAFSVPSINVVQSPSRGLPEWVTASEAAGEGTTAGKLKLQLDSGNKLLMEYGDTCPIELDRRPLERNVDEAPPPVSSEAPPPVSSPPRVSSPLTDAQAPAWEMKISDGNWIPAPFGATSRAAPGKRCNFQMEGLPAVVDFDSCSSGSITCKGKAYEVRQASVDLAAPAMLHKTALPALVDEDNFEAAAIAPPVMASPPPVPAASSRAAVVNRPGLDGTYKLTNVKSNLPLSVQGCSKTKRANVWQYHDEGRKACHWNLKGAPGDSYTVTNVNSGWLLYSQSKQKRANILQYHDDGTGASRWKLVHVEGDVYKVVNAACGWLLSVENGSKQKRANVCQNHADGSGMSMWRLSRLDAEIAVIKVLPPDESAAIAEAQQATHAESRMTLGGAVHANADAPRATVTWKEASDVEVCIVVNSPEDLQQVHTRLGVRMQEMGFAREQITEVTFTARSGKSVTVAGPEDLGPNVELPGEMKFVFDVSHQENRAQETSAERQVRQRVDTCQRDVVYKPLHSEREAELVAEMDLKPVAVMAAVVEQDPRMRVDTCVQDQEVVALKEFKASASQQLQAAIDDASGGAAVLEAVLEEYCDADVPEVYVAQVELQKRREQELSTDEPAGQAGEKVSKGKRSSAMFRMAKSAFKSVTTTASSVAGRPGSTQTADAVASSTPGSGLATAIEGASSSGKKSSLPFKVPKVSMSMPFKSKQSQKGLD